MPDAVRKPLKNIPNTILPVADVEDGFTILIVNALLVSVLI